MLSYQHMYHAGSFADLIKHVCLARVLEYMTQKNNPIFYLETHGGRGVYNLTSAESQKTQEANLGILNFWKLRQHAPDICQPFVRCVERLNASENIQYYPGSPQIALHLLRPQDRLYINELHPQEFQYLKQLNKHHKRVFFSNSDGMQQLKALLPPIESRACIFIDPSYEVKTDYQTIPSSIQTAYQRFSRGVFILWYPIIQHETHRNFIKKLQSIACPQHLCIEFDLDPTQNANMHGCGLWILNPPYLLKTEMNEFLHFIKQQLNFTKATIVVNS